MLLKGNKVRFGEFLLDTKEKVLFRAGEPVPMTPKPFELLLVLIENHGHLVEKNELIERVWADSIVEEGNLTYTMRLLRIALGDEKRAPRFIETISRRGYRFIAEVEDITEKASSSDALKSSREPFDKDSGAPPKLKTHLLPIAAVLLIGLVGAGFWLAKSRSLEAAAPFLTAPFSSEKL